MPAAPEPYLLPRALTFERLAEVGQPFESSEQLASAQGFKIGGYPAWHQHAKRYFCECGEPLAFLCQLPPDLLFAPLPDAPEQPNTSSTDHYVLFLGNGLYLFACPKQCCPESVWGVNQ